MKRNCFTCNKEIVIGHARYWQVDISLKDPYSQNVWRGEAEDAHAAFCEECEPQAGALFDHLEKAFKVYRETTYLINRFDGVWKKLAEK